MFLISFYTIQTSVNAMFSCQKHWRFSTGRQCSGSAGLTSHERWRAKETVKTGQNSCDPVTDLDMEKDPNLDMNPLFMNRDMYMDLDIDLDMDVNLILEGGI